MAERQLQRQEQAVVAATSSLPGRHTVEVEHVDGNAVRLQVNGTDTIAQVRQVALHEMRELGASADKYLVLSASGRVVGASETIDQVLTDGEALRLQLIPQAAFGRGRKE